MQLEYRIVGVRLGSFWETGADELGACFALSSDCRVLLNSCHITLAECAPSDSEGITIAGLVRSA